MHDIISFAAAACGLEEWSSRLRMKCGKISQDSFFYAPEAIRLRKQEESAEEL